MALPVRFGSAISLIKIVITIYYKVLTILPQGSGSMPRTKSTEESAVFQMRVPASLRDAFLRYAETQDQTASQLLRAYMRVCVQQSAKESA